MGPGARNSDKPVRGFGVRVHFFLSMILFMLLCHLLTFQDFMLHFKNLLSKKIILFPFLYKRINEKMDPHFQNS